MGRFTFAAREQLGGGVCFGAAIFDQEECCPYRYNIYILLLRCPRLYYSGPYHVAGRTTKSEKHLHVCCNCSKVEVLNTVRNGITSDQGIHNNHQPAFVVFPSFPLTSPTHLFFFSRAGNEIKIGFHRSMVKRARSQRSQNV